MSSSIDNPGAGILRDPSYASIEGHTETSSPNPIAAMQESISRTGKSRLKSVAQDTVLNVGKRWLTVPNYSAIPTVFAGSESFMDFVIPNNLHLLERMFLRFSLTVDDTVGTTYWLMAHQLIARLEIMFDYKVVETQYGNQMLAEYMSNETPQKIHNEYQGLGISAETYHSHPTNKTEPGGTRAFKIPLETVLTRNELLIHGIRDEIRVRVYFATSPVVQTGVSLSYQLKLPSLFLEETRLIPHDANRIYANYNSGSTVSIRMVERRRTQHPVSASTEELPINLQSHTGLAAGMLVYALKETSTPANRDNFQDCTTFRVTEESGRDIVPLQTSAFARQFISPSQWGSHCFRELNVDVHSTTDGQPFFWIPFGVHMQSAVTRGMMTGYHNLTGHETLQYAALGDAAVTLDVISYNYAFLEIVNGRVTVSAT